MSYIDKDATLAAIAQKAKDELADVNHYFREGVQLAVDVVEGMPEQRWIPCSERLPEDYEDVLVWYEYFRYSGYNRIAQTWDVGYYISEFNRWGGGVTGQKVRAIAWMPLPEPYRRANDG